jgi:uncharacterized protein (DUF885 family)
MQISDNIALMLPILQFLAISLILMGSTASPAWGISSEQLADALRDYDAFTIESDPIRAGQRNDPDALRKWPDNSPMAVADRVKVLRAILDQLQGQPDRLDADERLNLLLLRDRIQSGLDGYRFDEHRIPFLSGEGFYTLAETTASVTVIRSTEDAQSWIARLEALPAYFEREIANMQRGISTGFTQPGITVETAIHVMQNFAREPAEDSALLLPFAAHSSMLSQGEREALRGQAIVVIREKIRPAQSVLAEFFESQYLPAARTTLGASGLPDGRDYYAWLIRRHTTTSLAPDEVFEIGEREVARIREEMIEAARSTGHEGSLKSFVASLRQDPRFRAESAEDLMEKTSEILKRADYLLPGWFGTLPRLSYGVIHKAKGLESISSGYLTGSPEQGVAGAVILSSGGSNTIPLYSLPAWALHEGVPGHHLQIALAQERTDLPVFRRSDDMTAFVEGWALYAERLGEEMGLYRDAYERIGQLSMEMWRACRLIMDTGLHWKGWKYEQAASCLEENTALLPVTVARETRRYIGWPGQALAYKTGELEILRLRQKAKAALGDSFDIRSFHDAILVSGPMPLGILAQQVDVWIEKQIATPSGSNK